jgi:hypothetical protein
MELFPLGISCCIGFLDVKNVGFIADRNHEFCIKFNNGKTRVTILISREKPTEKLSPIRSFELTAVVSDNSSL